MTDKPYRCPIHGIPDCSPLLNGCSVPNEVARRISEATDAVYDAWARWLVRDTGAPWDSRPDVLPPNAVLDKMPRHMYEYDNLRPDGSPVHRDTTEDDYRGDLIEEWGVKDA